MTTPDTGVNVRFEDRWTLRYERTYEHPIDRVFRAVSEEEHLSEWMLGPHTIDLREGGAFTLTLGGVEHPGVVSRYEPPNVVELAFTGMPPTKIRFELTAVDPDKTVLAMFHHWGPLPDSDLPGFEPGSAGGWELLLAMELPNHLDGHPPLRTKDVPDLHAKYEHLLTEELPPPPAHSPLATFENRYSMRHVRRYDHPIERVWQAVTDPAQMEAWMLPHITIEPRLGGRATFTWGGPPDHPTTTEIRAWDPPRLVDYGGLRFELAALDDGTTELTFIQSFRTDFRQDQSTVPPGDPGGDLPGGPDTPWRPGFVGGFHLMLDNLATLLSGELAPSESRIDGHAPNTLAVYPPDWVWLCHVYRQHIKATIPPA